MKKTTKRHAFHLKRLGLFATLLLAFFVVRLDAGSLPQAVYTSRVLAYASEMSRSGLLAGTNAARGANGLGGLALDSQLNNSAQAKAQHMASNNYWAHVAPDGTQPWYFFAQAGYTYVKAGENLAYGFMSSQGTIDGWMNSPTHRANILGNYNDVGFGIVNTPDYQSNGQQTIVVAHYGTRSSPPPAPAPAPVQAQTPAAPVAPTPPQASPVSAAPSSEETNPVPSNKVAKPEPDSPVIPPERATTEPVIVPQPTTPPPAAPIQLAASSRVSVLSMMTNRNLPVAALASLVMLSFTIVGYALTHRVAFQHAVTSGEHFVLRHPGIDSSIIAAVSALILLTTYGNIQ